MTLLTTCATIKTVASKAPRQKVITRAKSWRNITIRQQGKTAESKVMRKAELNNYKKLIADYYDGRDFDDATSLADKLKLNREAARLPQDSDTQAAMRLVEGGEFAIYYTEIEADMREVYGDDYKSEIYRTQSGEFRVKHGEVYIWTVYKAKMAQTINAIIDGKV